MSQPDRAGCVDDHTTYAPMYGGEEATCPSCGRDHIPDEHEGHDMCVECLDGYGDDQ